MKKRWWEGAFLGLFLLLKSWTDRMECKVQSQGPVPKDRPSPALLLQVWNKDFLGNICSFAPNREILGVLCIPWAKLLGGKVSQHWSIFLQLMGLKKCLQPTSTLDFLALEMQLQLPGS